MNPPQPLTAADGAERVAERWRRGRPAAQSEDEALLYTCEQCGSHEFEVHFYFDDVKTATESLDCSCGEAEEWAARRERRITRANTWKGTLGTDHRVEWTEQEEEAEEEIVEIEIECQNCAEDAGDEAWDVECDEEFEPAGEDEHWEVRCSACDHEIEFGWSHPDRGGRFWPCESADFNPWKCIPEQRFVGAWKEREWLRPPGRSVNARLKRSDSGMRDE